MTLIDACWMFMETKQWMLAQWGGGWRISAVATMTWKTNYVLDGHAQLSHNKIKSISIASSTRIGGLWLGNCVWSWISASVRWKQWWQHWNITKFAPGGSHKCSYRNIKNTVCKFVGTYLTNTRLKVTISWFASLPVMRCGVTTTSWSQNGSPWSGDMNCPSKKRFKTLPSVSKVMCTVFWGTKGVILLDFLEPRQTINSDRYIAMLTKLKARISRVRPEKKTTFLLQHDSAWPHTSLKTVEHIISVGWSVIPHPPYSLDSVPSDFHLFRPMKDGLCGQHFPSYAVIRAMKQWATSACADFYLCGVQALFHR